MRKWEEIPKFMRCSEVKHYYDILQKHKFSLKIKKYLDIVLSCILLLVLSPVFVILSVIIKLDSPGPVFFKQIRVTQYGRKFYIYKFRTMVDGADKLGAQVTGKNDKRITKAGALIRDCRLDEIPQLLNVMRGEMSFVGTRPEVVKYVIGYTDEMKATLLLPAGITSIASVKYKDEDELLKQADNVDEVYVHSVLPEKMKYNLEMLESFNFIREMKVMFDTLMAVIRRRKK